MGIEGYIGLWLLFAYGIGSIPFGMVCAHVAGLGDIRRIGSGNIGATNVLRTGNKGAALATLLLDSLKGVGAVMAVMYGAKESLDFAPQLPLWAGVCAFLGHLFPLWLKGKGGKGVATFLGLQFALNGPLIGLLSCAVWLGGWKFTKISSVGGMSMAVVTAGVLWILLPPQEAVFHTLMAVLLVWRHRENIARLIRGEEGASRLSKESPSHGEDKGG